MDFWIKFCGYDKGWAVELLRDGDRVSEHVARFAPGGRYHGMPIAQHAVIDFISKPTAAKVRDGVVSVYFQDNFASAVMYIPGKQPTMVRLRAS